jgi:hypothetical protein
MTTPTQETPTVTIQNIYKAAYLVSTGLLPVNIKTEGSRTWFTFDNFEGQATNLLDRWHRGEALIRPDAYIQARQQLINAINYHRHLAAQGETAAHNV